MKLVALSKSKCDIEYMSSYTPLAAKALYPTLTASSVQGYERNNSWHTRVDIKAKHTCRNSFDCVIVRDIKTQDVLSQVTFTKLEKPMRVALVIGWMICVLVTIYPEIQVFCPTTAL